MKLTPTLLLTIIATITLTSLTRADEIPLDRAQEGARKLNESIPQTGDFQLTISPDVEKPQTIKSGEIALMVVPDQSLTATTLSEAKDTPVPLAQLWAMNLVVAKDGHASEAAQQRPVTLHTKDKDLSVNLYLLGAVRNAQGGLDLVIYGKDKEPLTHLPLTAADGASQNFPIEMHGEKQDDNTGLLTLSILGKHKVDVVMKRAN